jgi:hypothetical protein
MTLQKEHVPGLEAASDLLIQWTYSLPGREAEWCRHLAKRLNEVAYDVQKQCEIKNAKVVK